MLYRETRSSTFPLRGDSPCKKLIGQRLDALVHLLNFHSLFGSTKMDGCQTYYEFGGGAMHIFDNCIVLFPADLA